MERIEIDIVRLPGGEGLPLPKRMSERASETVLVMDRSLSKGVMM